MNKLLLSIIFVIAIISVYAYTFRDLKIVYKDEGLLLKSSFLGIERERIIVKKEELPNEYEMQTQYDVQFSPARDKIAFAMNEARFGGQAGGELYIRNKLFVVSLNGELQEIYFDDLNIGREFPEDSSDSWEVEKWLDGSRILVDRQAGHYTNLSLGKLIVNVSGVIETREDNANLEEDFRKLKAGEI